MDDIVRLFGAKITVTTPLHQNNVHEVPALRKRWAHHGTEVAFSQLQTRATHLTSAKRIALGATGGFWKADLLDISSSIGTAPF